MQGSWWFGEEEENEISPAPCPTSGHTKTRSCGDSGPCIHFPAGELAGNAWKPSPRPSPSIPRLLLCSCPIPSPLEEVQVRALAVPESGAPWGLATVSVPRLSRSLQGVAQVPPEERPPSRPPPGWPSRPACLPVMVLGQVRGTWKAPESRGAHLCGVCRAAAWGEFSSCFQRSQRTRLAFRAGESRVPLLQEARAVHRGPWLIV